MTNKNAYAQSGVDVEAGYEVVERIKKHVARTERAGVMGALGGFGGMFDLSKTGVKEPVLISGTDGVGTKLMLAIKYDKHDTIGQDCVAMCVNDIIAAGAEPLDFLDYIATGKNEPAKLEQVVAGVAEGCVQAGAALIGGETAEMPGMYGEDDYDLAGFAVGVAEKSQIIDGSKVAEGDVILGLASSGIHSNGYSLVRRVFADYTGEEVLPELEGKKLKDVLLEPTRIYVKAALPLIKEELVNGIAHITGGGFIENVPRMFSDDLAAEIDESKVPVLPIFKALEKYGQIKHEEMFEIFNMGIGLMLAVKPENVERVKELLDMKIAVFASGNGSNCQVIAEQFPVEFVFSDHRDAYVLERAKNLGVVSHAFELKEFDNKAAYEEAIVKLLNEHQIDLVCLAGYMKIVGPTLLAAYEGRIINIHPAYLPEFPGAHGIEDAWNAGVAESGVTIHWVDSGVDTGKVIKQVRVPRLESDTLDTFETRIHETEYKLYPEVLERLGVARK